MVAKGRAGPDAGRGRRIGAAKTSVGDRSLRGSKATDTVSRLTSAAQASADVAHASMRTIGFRTAMMARAAGDPVALADPEFTRMVREKIEAFAGAGGAVMGGVQALHGLWAAAMIGQVLGTVQACAALASCRTPADVAAVQGRWLAASQSEAVRSVTRIMEATFGLYGASLDPIHAVVTANARRLARR